MEGHHHHSHEHSHEHRFNFGLFFLVMTVELAALLGLYYWITPTVFMAEVQSGWMIPLWIFLLGIPVSLFEYLYHRYLLHSSVLPWLGAMHDAHSTHHGLTRVKAPVTPNEPAKLVPVESEYPIEEDHQEESMMFPLWSMPIFVVVFLILLGLPLKLIFPAQPVIFTLMLTVTVYLMIYEVWHAILHLPYERFWQPFVNHRRLGKLGRHMYGFHLMHHWRPTSNLAIVGFWGIALWDHAFKTHRRPERMPLKGAEVNYHDAELKKPLWPISLLDRWQKPLYKASRGVEKFFARMFRRRKSAS